jgi:flagellar basal body rod protein FlgG
MIERLRLQMQAMQMLSQSQEVTADNLANINTPGFKGTKVFYRMLRQEVDGEMRTKTIPRQELNMEQGVLDPTGGTFDFGIKGKGFFVVEDENGQHLTRDGRFRLNPDGFLVNKQGAKVMGHSGPVYIPGYMKADGGGNGNINLQVAKDGTIRLNNKVAGQFRVVKAEDISRIEREGSSYFEAPEGTLIEDSDSLVMQGYYEKSNVEPLTQMVDMMRTMKMFQSQQRALRATGEMMGQVSNQLGKF